MIAREAKKKFGYYSAKAEKAIGYWLYRTDSNKVVKVTSVQNGPYVGGWKDIEEVGEVTEMVERVPGGIF